MIGHGSQPMAHEMPFQFGTYATITQLGLGNLTGTRFSIEVRPTQPPRLQRLEELANDLMYSWDRRVRGLFDRLDPALRQDCGHRPKAFLRRVAQERRDAAAEDRVFIEDYNRALSAYDTYHQEAMRPDAAPHLQPNQDLIAYFCAEFGLHESLPIYSGGLGILAGDHCKAASDLSIPFIAVGMLYRQGYFNQTIDGHGKQVAHYTRTDFSELPLKPARDRDGGELHVQVHIADREVTLKVWQAKAGHIYLYLLDSDVAENSDADRSITYQLYGGDIHTRMQQEIVLGIGGVRALRALGLKPTVWHINDNKKKKKTDQLYGGDIHTRMQQEIVLGIGGVRALRALGLKPTVWHIN